MKTIRHNILLVLLMLPCITLAGNGVKGKYTKEKKISKVYLVNDNCALDVNNKFGNIYVTTWDENKMSIDVSITVSGNNEDKVNKKLAGILIDINATKSLLSARTNIDNSVNGNNMSIEINYIIKIPKKGAIDLNNQYGGIITGKIYGKAKIDCQYGDINLDELNADGNTIMLQYSNTSRINYIKSGSVNVQYSTFKLGKAGTLKLQGQYTGMNLEEVQDLTYKTEYGDLSVKKSGKASGSGDYSALRFGQVSGPFNATCNYGDVRIAALDKSVKNVAINASYTNVTVKYEEDYAFDFEFHTEYGNVNGTGGFKFTEKSVRDTSASYKGYNRSSGTNRMYIKTEYGNISLGKS